MAGAPRARRTVAKLRVERSMTLQDLAALGDGEVLVADLPA